MSGDAIVLALRGRGLPESAEIAAALWHDSAADVASALHSPFVKSLADGSLPKYACSLAHAVSSSSCTLCQTYHVSFRQAEYNILIKHLCQSSMLVQTGLSALCGTRRLLPESLCAGNE